jgi:tRNA G18 (ribose-2'-O)-methylase SpoU
MNALQPIPSCFWRWVGVWHSCALHACNRSVENAGSIRVAAVLRRPANVDLLSWGAHEATGGKHVPLQRVLCLDAVQDPGNLGTLIRR